MAKSNDKAMQFVQDGAVVGGVAGLASLGMQMALRRTNLTYLQKGGISAAAGIVTGLLLANRMPRVAIGLVAFGVSAGVAGAAEEVRLQNYLTRVTGTATLRPAVAGTAASSGLLGAGRQNVAGYTNLAPAGAVRAMR